MTSIKEIAVDGTIVGIGAALLGKAHEVLIKTKESHGTMLKWDKKITMFYLKDNIKGTVLAGTVAALTFSAASWVSHIKKDKSKPASDISLRGK